MDITQPKQVHFGRFHRITGQRITEKQQQINLVAGDQRRDLLISALRTVYRLYP